MHCINYLDRAAGVPVHDVDCVYCTIFCSVQVQCSILVWPRN